MGGNEQKWQPLPNIVFQDYVRVINSIAFTRDWDKVAGEKMFTLSVFQRLESSELFEHF